MQAPTFTTALGFALTLRAPSLTDELQAHGLHRTDKRFTFAVTALRACRPSTWPRLLAKFGHPPAAVQVPVPARPLDDSDLGPSACAAIESTRAAIQSVENATAPAAVWALMTHAVLAWRRHRPSETGEALAVITVILQALGERQIQRIDAAFFYAVSLHPEWRETARAWLEPYRETWLRDWLAVRPEFISLAADARDGIEDIPAWLCGVEK